MFYIRNDADQLTLLLSPIDYWAAIFKFQSELAIYSYFQVITVSFFIELTQFSFSAVITHNECNIKKHIVIIMTENKLFDVIMWFMHERFKKNPFSLERFFFHDNLISIMCSYFEFPKCHYQLGFWKERNKIVNILFPTKHCIIPNRLSHKHAYATTLLEHPTYGNL